MRNRVPAFFLVTLLCLPTANAEDEPTPPCTGLLLLSPGTAFPENTTDPLRLGIRDASDFSLKEIDFDGDFEADFPAPAIFREDGGAYVSVEYSLEPSPDGDALSRTLVLASREPGKYLTTWDHDTCSAERFPESDSPIANRFEITPTAELPTSLDQVTVESEDLGREVHTNFYYGDDPELEPWLASLRVTVEFDGVPMEPFGPVTNPERYLHIYRCSDELVEPGAHEAVLVAHVSGVELRSEGFEVEITCEEVAPSKGCTASEGSPTEGALLLVLVTVRIARRRRRV